MEHANNPIESLRKRIENILNASIGSANTLSSQIVDDILEEVGVFQNNHNPQKEERRGPYGTDTNRSLEHESPAMSSISERIFNHALDMLCIAGFDGYFKTLNPAWTKTLGWSTEELLSKPWVEFVHPDDRKPTESIKSLIVDGEEVYLFENRYICKDGSVKWLSWNSYPYPQENIMFGVARDITFKKQAEERLFMSELKLKEQVEEYVALNEELNQANEELRNLMENLSESTQRTSALVAANPDLMFVYNKEGVFLDYHAPNTQALLLKPEEFLYKSGDEVLPKFLAEMNGQAIKTLFETGKPQTYSYSLEIKGNTFHFDARLVRYGRDKALAIIRDITEKKNFELAISQQEQYLRTVIQTSPDGFWVVDRKGRLLDVNEAYCNMSGYTKEEVLKLSLKDIDANENPIETASRIKRIIETGSETFDTIHRRKDGSMFYVEISTTYLENNQGEFVCFIRDITERRKVQEDIVNLASMLDLAPSAITVHDFEGNFLYTNQHNLNLHGYEHNELMRINLHQIDVPESEILINERIRKIKDCGETTFEVEHYRKDGSQFPLMLFVKQVNWKGKPAFLSIGTDITEQKLAEQALRESENRFQLSMEATNDGLWDWSVQSDDAYYGPAYYTMLGYDVGEFPSTGDTWINMVHPDDREKAQTLNNDCIEGVINGFELEYRMKTKAGQWLWILSRGKCVERDKNGRATRIIGTHVDITDRKQAELELLKRNHNINFLAQRAMSFVDIHSLKEFYSFIGDSVHQLYPDAFLMVNTVNIGDSYLTTEKVYGNGSIISKVISLLGYDLAGKKHSINNSVIKAFDGKLVKIEGGISEFTMGNVPKKLFQTIEKLLSINTIYGIAIISNKEIVSSIGMIFPKGSDIDNVETLEAFVKQASIAYNGIVAEENLSKSEQKYRHLAENISDVIWTTDINFNLTYISPSIEKMVGESVEMQHQRTWRRSIHPIR